MLNKIPYSDVRNSGVYPPSHLAAIAVSGAAVLSGDTLVGALPFPSGCSRHGSRRLLESRFPRQSDRPVMLAGTYSDAVGRGAIR